MAGHSKWANIKHKKGRQDAKRGKIFTKLIREITVAAKLGGEDSGSNPRLRAAIDAALSQNMTKDTIERAVKRGAGSDESDNMEEVRYEGYGPGGVAVMVDCMTDNKNRTVAEIRHAFSKMGGNMGTDGSVSYLFNKIGVINFAPGADEDTVMAAALEGGAEDVVVENDSSIEVITTPEDFGAVKDALDAASLTADMAEVTMRASTSVDLDEGQAQTMMKLTDMLEDLDDVQEVYSNAEISEEILESLG